MCQVGMQMPNAGLIDRHRISGARSVSLTISHQRIGGKGLPFAGERLQSRMATGVNAIIGGIYLHRLGPCCHLLIGVLP